MRDYLTYVPSDVGEEVKTVLVAFYDKEGHYRSHDKYLTGDEDYMRDGEDIKNDGRYRVYDLETGKVCSIFQSGRRRPNNFEARVFPAQRFMPPFRSFSTGGRGQSKFEKVKVVVF